MTIQCCVCGKIRADGQWSLHHEERHGDNISHTYCPICLKEALNAAEIVQGKTGTDASEAGYERRRACPRFSISPAASA
jgi:hypothetical protein